MDNLFKPQINTDKMDEGWLLMRNLSKFVLICVHTALRTAQVSMVAF